MFESERRFFGSASDNLMGDHSVKATLKLIQRQKDVMSLDKQTCLGKQVLDISDEQHSDIRTLRGFHAEFCA